MKTAALIAIALICSAALLRAQSTHDREFTQLTEQRDKALAAAAEPINRRYQAALEQLLRRATQANNLETAVKIKSALQTLANPSEPASMNVTGKWHFRFEGRAPVERELKADGTVQRGDGKPGKWNIKGSTLQVDYPEGAGVVFDLPVRDGKLLGKGTETGKLITAERK
jgi:hypothetical protein